MGAQITGVRHGGLPLRGSANCSPNPALSSKAHAQLLKMCLSPTEANEAQAAARRAVRGLAFRSRSAGLQPGKAVLAARCGVSTKRSGGVCSMGWHTQAGFNLAGGVTVKAEMLLQGTK